MDSNDLKNFEFLKEIIKEGDGDYTVFFKNQLNGSGLVYSVELHPETYESLRVKFKNENNIKTFNYAVCDIDGDVEYYKGRDAWTNNIIGHDMSFSPNQSLGLIEGITLDTLLKDEKIIKLIKVDVEGAEKLVLNGMRNVINRVENLLIECHLDEDWYEINKILLQDFNLKCINLSNGDEINEKSNRTYQCLCKKKN